MRGWSRKEQREERHFRQREWSAKHKAEPAEILGNVATPLRTLGSSILAVAEGLAGAGRKSESAIILEKISSTITSNRDTKM